MMETLILLWAMLGVMVRARNDGRAQFNVKDVRRFALFIVVAYTINQSLVIGFAGATQAVLFVGVLFVAMELLDFKAYSYPALFQTMPEVRSAIQFMGRRTLEIYVVHLLVFKWIAVSFAFAGYSWFELRWML